MNKLFAILIMCSLSLPVLAIEEQEAVLDTQNSNAVEETTQNDVVLPSEKQLLDTTYKQPMSKKKLAKKFIIAMLCVVGTSIFLYGTLSIYNKIRDSIALNGADQSEDEKPLDAPSDLTEAVKTFIDKTRWEG